MLIEYAVRRPSVRWATLLVDGMGQVGPPAKVMAEKRAKTSIIKVFFIIIFSFTSAPWADNRFKNLFVGLS